MPDSEFDEGVVEPQKAEPERLDSAVEIAAGADAISDVPSGGEDTPDSLGTCSDEGPGNDDGGESLRRDGSAGGPGMAGMVCVRGPQLHEMSKFEEVSEGRSTDSGDGDFSQDDEAEGASSRGRKTQEERRAAAFRAFLEILETADWIKQELRPQMEILGISLEGLRFLEMLYTRERVTIREAAEKRHCTKQSVENLVKRLRGRGWVECEVERVTVTGERDDETPRRRSGWRVAYVRLSDEGEKFVASVLPRNVKLVLAFMRALEWREQEALIRTCRKLREGNILRFLREMEFEDGDDS